MVPEVRALKVLLNAEQIQEGVARVAGAVSQVYGRRPLTIIGVMTGSLVFLADLIRKLEMPLRVGVIQARSYRGTATIPGQLVVNADLLPDIRGREVLLADDIFDTGHTLDTLVRQVRDLKAATVRSAVFLRKRARHEVDLEPDFVAFDIPNEFVVGYGLDYQDEYRNLPFVAALEPAELERHPAATGER
jgi:hypoxanthine phosphoribosyltransferase